VQLDLKASLDSLVHKDLLESEVRWAIQDPLDIRDHKVLLDNPEIMAILVHLEELELLVCQVLLDLRGA
jgi:hypothetical protein